MLLLQQHTIVWTTFNGKKVTLFMPVNWGHYNPCKVVTEHRVDCEKVFIEKKKVKKKKEKANNQFN